jgi:hypothetical protein
MTRMLTRRGALFSVLRRVAPIALKIDRVADKLGRGVGMLDLRVGGLARLANPEIAPGERLHDRVTSKFPTLVHWGDESLLVRPDLVVASAGSLPHMSEVTVARPGRTS